MHRRSDAPASFVRPSTHPGQNAHPPWGCSPRRPQASVKAPAAFSGWGLGQATAAGGGAEGRHLPRCALAARPEARAARARPEQGAGQLGWQPPAHELDSGGTHAVTARPKAAAAPARQRYRARGPEAPRRAGCPLQPACRCQQQPVYATLSRATLEKGLAAAGRHNRHWLPLHSAAPVPRAVHAQPSPSRALPLLLLLLLLLVPRCGLDSGTLTAACHITCSGMHARGLHCHNFTRYGFLSAPTKQLRALSAAVQHGE